MMTSSFISKTLASRMIIKLLSLLALFSVGTKALAEGEKQIVGHNDPRHHHTSDSEFFEQKHGKICPIHSKDFVIVHTRVPRCEAETVCERMGMTLANINSKNFDEAAHLAYKCSGPIGQSWINSWNGDYYKGSCIVLSTNAHGAAINTPYCSENLPVLCQKIHHHPHHQHPHHHHHGHIKHEYNQLGECADCDIYPPFPPHRQDFHQQELGEGMLIGLHRKPYSQSKKPCRHHHRRHCHCHRFRGHKKPNRNCCCCHRHHKGHRVFSNNNNNDHEEGPFGEMRRRGEGRQRPFRFAGSDTGDDN